MNISVTTLCNRSCAYCFARTIAGRNGHMDLATFTTVLGFLGRSQIGQARLLGGEPTLHPQFDRLIDAVEQRGLDLLIFSNGQMPKRVIDRLARFPREKLFILLNVREPESLDEKAQQQFLQVCTTLDSRVSLGYNIDSPAKELDFLLPLVLDLGLASQIRLGLAHPCIGVDNSYLHPRYYRTVGKTIGAFARQAYDQGIRIELDCGFVPCMFADEDLLLFREWGEIPGRRCNPLPDLLPDGRFVPCYPLGGVVHCQGLDQGRNDTVQAQLATQLTVFRQAGIFASCGGCSLRSQAVCTGGCLAAALRRMRHLPLSYSTTRRRHSSRKVAPVTESDTAPVPIRAKGQWAIPYIDQPLSFWQKLAARFGQHIAEVYCPLPNGAFPTGRPLQKSDHLAGFLHSVSLPVGIILNPVVLPQPVETIASHVIEQIRRLLDRVKLVNLTVASIDLAYRLKEAFPDLPLTASVMMDVTRPHQAMLLNGLCERLVPSSRIMRNLQALRDIRQAFTGKIRLMVNEACLPDCLLRTQHFYEMSYSSQPLSSLCGQLLEHSPWLRLTGAWVLPQHLHLFSGIADEMKLAGRVTLQYPEKYLRVLTAYATGTALTPDAIGGGPASVLGPVEITEDFYQTTLSCNHHCHSCGICREYAKKVGMR